MESEINFDTANLRFGYNTDQGWTQNAKIQHFLLVYHLHNVEFKTFPVCLQAERSNFRHRPIGIGVQGLADAFILMRYPFESPEAQQLNKDIFETIYFASLDASCELAEKLGYYETYPGSPVSKGVSI